MVVVVFRDGKIRKCFDSNLAVNLIHNFWKRTNKEQILWGNGGPISLRSVSFFCAVSTFFFFFLFSLTFKMPQVSQTPSDALVLFKMVLILSFYEFLNSPVSGAGAGCGAALPFANTPKLPLAVCNRQL